MIVSTLMLVGCDREQGTFLDVCEAEIKSRLRSPAGYARVEVAYAREPLSPDRYLAKRQEDGEEELPDFIRKMVEEGRYKSAYYTAFVSHDAPNAFGTLIRGASKCTYLSREGDLESLDKMSIRINGKNFLERLKEML